MNLVRATKQQACDARMSFAVAHLSAWSLADASYLERIYPDDSIYTMQNADCCVGTFQLTFDRAFETLHIDAALGAVHHPLLRNEAFQVFEQFAKDNGMKRVAFETRRPGLAKVGAMNGYEKVGEIYAKEVV
jgi:hypothetical protein